MQQPPASSDDRSPPPRWLRAALIAYIALALAGTCVLLVRWQGRFP